MTTLRTTNLGRALCLGGASLGAIGLIGWLTNVQALVTIVPGQPPMMPNTALALLLQGSAAVLSDAKHSGRAIRLLSWLAASVVFVIGIGTLAEYTFDLPLSIDQLLVRAEAGSYPGRPSPPTAVALACLAAATLLRDVPSAMRVQPLDWLLLCAGLIALTALLGQAFGTGALYRLTRTPITGVAVHTALGLLMISVGQLLRRPDAGFMRIAFSPSPGGMLLRRLAPIAILVPVLFGLTAAWLLALPGIEDFSLIFAALIVVSSVVSVLLLTITAERLNRAQDARKRAEDEVSLSEAKFSEIVSISADAIILIDEDQKITLFNEGAEKIFGWSSAEVIGGSLDILIPERFRAIHARHVETFAAGAGAARRMGTRGSAIFGVRKNGHEFPADAAISGIVIDGKRILTVALRDITELKEAEAVAKRSAQARAAALAESQQSQREQQFLAEAGSILASSLDYDQTLTSVARLAVREFADVSFVDLIEENGEIRRLRAVSRNPSLDWACEILSIASLDRNRHPFAGPTLKEGRPILMESVSPETVVSLAQDNPERLRALRGIDSKSVITVPLMADGKIFGMLAFVSSASSRQFTADDLRLAQALAHQAALAIEKARLYRVAQRALQARDEVLGIVAHDLRNLLHVIILEVDSLNRLRGGQEPDSRCAAGSIHRTAVRMNRIIQDLLEISRVEAGGLVVERSRVPVNQMTGDAVEAQKSVAAEASVDLRLEVARDVPDVWADRDRLLQVFDNLVGNALKFTPPGGHIRVGAALNEDEVRFWVADTGVGIATEDLPHVFDRFWQARKGERRGTGLGLTIVKSIIEAHGGRIWVESALGRGTTFFFAIPAADQNVGDSVRAGQQSLSK